MLLHWAYIESDFLHFYNIDSPLTLVWTKFRRLLFALPPESIFFRILQQKTEHISKESQESPNQWAKDKLREKFKLKPRKVENVMTLDEYSVK
mgnify:CR=1 FL=1